MNKEHDKATGQKLPPYIAFQSMKTLLEKLKNDGLPGQIDRSVLTNFSGSVRAQVITALRFLNLMGTDGRPTPALKAMVDSYGTDMWPTMLTEVLKKGYPRIFEIELANASFQQFSAHFKSIYPGQDAVLQKCMGFFLNAAREAQLPISNYISKKQKVRSSPTKKRSAPAKPPQRHAHHQNPPPPPSGNGDDTTPKSPPEVLLSLLSLDMKQPEQDAIWTLIKHFKAKEEKAA